MKDYGKMDVVSVEQQFFFVTLEQTCNQQQEQSIIVNM
jgi:hypothetical protein